MLTRLMPFLALALGAVPARAQESRTTFGGLPHWADSALRAGGLDQRFRLSSVLNPVYEVGDFDRDGLIDVAVEVKDPGALRCGLMGAPTSGCRSTKGAARDMRLQLPGATVLSAIR